MKKIFKKYLPIKILYLVLSLSGELYGGSFCSHNTQIKKINDIKTLINTLVQEQQEASQKIRFNQTCVKIEGLEFDSNIQHNWNAYNSRIEGNIYLSFLYFKGLKGKLNDVSELLSLFQTRYHICSLRIEFMPPEERLVVTGSEDAAGLVMTHAASAGDLPPCFNYGLGISESGINFSTRSDFSLGDDMRHKKSIWSRIRPTQRLLARSNSTQTNKWDKKISDPVFNRNQSMQLKTLSSIFSLNELTSKLSLIKPLNALTLSFLRNDHTWVNPLLLWLANSNCRLTYLNLSHNDLRELSLTTLKHILGSNTTLKSLTLDSNPITSTHFMHELGQGLQLNSSLQSLSLRDTGIRAESLARLLTPFRNELNRSNKDRALRHLDLSDNLYLGDTSIQLLSHFLSAFPVLTELRLSNCSLSGNSIHCLSDCFKENRDDLKLRLLDLSKNIKLLTGGKPEDWVSWIASTPGLSFLNLDDCKTSSKDMLVNHLKTLLQGLDRRPLYALPLKIKLKGDFHIQRESVDGLIEQMLSWTHHYPRKYPRSFVGRTHSGISIEFNPLEQSIHWQPPTDIWGTEVMDLSESDLSILNCKVFNKLEMTPKEQAQWGIYQFLHFKETSARGDDLQESYSFLNKKILPFLMEAASTEGIAAHALFRLKQMGLLPKDPTDLTSQLTQTHLTRLTSTLKKPHLYQDLAMSKICTDAIKYNPSWRYDYSDLAYLNHLKDAGSKGSILGLYESAMLQLNRFYCDDSNEAAIMPYVEFETLKRLAHYGYVPAVYTYAYCLERGILCEKNIAEAYDLYQSIHEYSDSAFVRSQMMDHRPINEIDSSKLLNWVTAHLNLTQSIVDPVEVNRILQPQIDGLDHALCHAHANLFKDQIEKWTYRIGDAIDHPTNEERCQALYKTCLNLYERAMEKGSQKARLEKAKLQASLAKNITDRIAFLREAADLGDDHAKTLLAKALKSQLASKVTPDAAEASYNEISTLLKPIAPKSSRNGVEANLMLAYLALERGKGLAHFQEAQQHLREAIRLAPNVKLEANIAPYFLKIALSANDQGDKLYHEMGLRSDAIVDYYKIALSLLEDAIALGVNQSSDAKRLLEKKLNTPNKRAPKADFWQGKRASGGHSPGPSV